jgi:hypothetical protein
MRAAMIKVHVGGLMSYGPDLNESMERTAERALRGRQSGADLKPPQAAVVKNDGGERGGKVGTRSIERGDRKRTADDVSKAD